MSTHYRRSGSCSGGVYVSYTRSSGKQKNELLQSFFLVLSYYEQISSELMDIEWMIEFDPRNNESN